MIGWTRLEKRWLDRLLNAMIPAPESLGPDGAAATAMGAPISVNNNDFWPRFRHSAPPLLQIGLRVAVWLLTWGPLFLIGRFRTFKGLSPVDRDRLLVKVDGHPRFLARQLALVVKTVACWAAFADPNVRRAIGGPEVDELQGMRAKETQ